MKVFAVAMAEVQDGGSVICCSDAFFDWNDAVDVADGFMTGRVGDFYKIGSGDWEARRAKVEERVQRKTYALKGDRKLECHYKAEGLVVATSVQETEII